MFERFTEQAHLVLDLARHEAERAGHRYLGPEHLVLGVLAEGHSRGARILRAHRIELATARTELLVRRSTEQAFGATAVGQATWRVTRRRGWRGTRVTWTPLCGPPFFAKRALQLASEQARTLGHGAVGPEHLVLGVLADVGEPAGRVRVPRRHRRITAHVGLPDGYRGAAGPLLAALGVDLDALRDAVTAELRGTGR